MCRCSLIYFFNSFLGEASSLYSTDAAKIQSDFANRRIDKRTHDIQMANLNSGGKMMVDSLTGYTALINDLEEKKECITAVKCVAFVQTPAW